MTQESTGACAYELDAEFRIRSVDAAWVKFAQANEAPELAALPGPVGYSLFAFIRDATTVHLYRRLFERVRRTEQAAVFPFRCDGPRVRRFLEMAIRPSPSSGLALHTRVVRLEPRAANMLLARTAQRSSEMLRACGWCNAVEVRGRWCEVEEAVVTLRLFEQAPLPTITHGICPPCYQRMDHLIK